MSAWSPEQVSRKKEKLEKILSRCFPRVPRPRLTAAASAGATASAAVRIIEDQRYLPRGA